MNEMVRTQVYLPRDMVDLLKQRSKARGITMADQIREALTAYIARMEDKDDPILRADDPIFNIAGKAASGIGDLSIHHDKYLYRKDWLERPEEGTAE